MVLGIAGPEALSEDDVPWQEPVVDSETSTARWAAEQGGIHSVRVAKAGDQPEDGAIFTLRVSIDPGEDAEPPEETSAELIERVRQFDCEAISPGEANGAFAAGALDGVQCQQPRRGVHELRLYQFPGMWSLRAFHRQRLAEVRPTLASTSRACRLGRRGVTKWAHGRVACWVPDGRRRIVLHWTDERTNTYGVLRTFVHANRRPNIIWRDLLGTIG